jgi:hypothetical protein
MKALSRRGANKARNESFCARNSFSKSAEGGLRAIYFLRGMEVAEKSMGKTTAFIAGFVRARIICLKPQTPPRIKKSAAHSRD